MVTPCREGIFQRKEYTCEAMNPAPPVIRTFFGTKAGILFHDVYTMSREFVDKILFGLWILSFEDTTIDDISDEKLRA